MTSILRPLLHHVRLLIVVALAYMVLAVSVAHVRATVMVQLAENGVTRFYETEAVHHGSAEVRLAALRMGRAPFEERPLRHQRGAWPSSRAVGRLPQSPASPRAPPHQPRAPPLA